MSISGAAGEPDLVAGAKLGRDRGEAQRQRLDPHVAEIAFEQSLEAVAADQARSADVEIEQPHDPALGERQGEGFELVEARGCIAAADDGADRAAGDHVGDDALALEDAHDADMRPAARGARPEGEADLQLPARLARDR